METITDPAEIRATSDERGCCDCRTFDQHERECILPDERTTPTPVGAAVALDLDALHETICDNFTGMAEVRQAADLLVAEVRRLTRLGQCDLDLLMRAEAAEAEVVTLRDTLARRTDSHTQLVRENETLRAKVAEAEAKRDEFAYLLARALPAVAALARVEALGDSNPDHADTCGSMLTPGAGYPCSCWQADLRAALAATGEGQ